ncbi:MAG: glycosyltransferase family 9 protein [Salinivirgaceae bacterium]|nr:glycosyltransferase family 9 protein [Salinivirgaceae bacterium]MDD4747308.1 glycosyltransferase family 9 protein [Salinivirgaceae bacterium]MDY0281276.1 glycosyltransferase family 9 protein [Salinivirgaceae bacterium]
MTKYSCNKILIIQTAFIGDVVLATALVEKLKTFYSNSTIDILVRKGNESLLTTNPHIKEILIWNKKTSKYRSLLTLIFAIRKRKYDIVINVQRFLSSGLITTFSNAPIKSGFRKNPLSFFLQNKADHNLDGTHEIERNQKLIEFLTDNKPAQPKLYLSKEVEEHVAHYQTEKYICIAPASIWFTKQFPERKWIELINRIGTEYKIYLLGSKADNSLCQRIVKSSNGNVVDLSGELNLLESTALMKGAVMNYVNDSAPLHLCSSVNAPVVAVFCSTIPQFGFGPTGSNGKIVETTKKLPCRPCGLHGRKACPLTHFDCAMSIEIDALLKCIPE